MIKAKFYETYYFCSVVINVLRDQFTFLPNLDEFYGDGEIFYLIEPFEKYSAFHRFVEFIVEDIYYSETSKVDMNKRRKIVSDFKGVPSAMEDSRPYSLPIELAFEFHSIEFESFTSFLNDKDKPYEDCDEDDIYDYMNDLRLSQEYQDLVQMVVKETFHVLFQNRTLMLEFNDMMAAVLSNSDQMDCPDDQKSLFSQSGRLRRVTIPKWVQRAVFFRNRGRCVLCDKDLSGIINMENETNYDHIVPLAKHGLNDVSNIQLLCKECNQNEKADDYGITSDKYQSWYVYD